MSRRKLPPSRLDNLPKKYRRLLSNYGAPPGAHPRAEEFNARLIAFADQGMRGMDLAMAACALHDDFFGDTLTRNAIATHFIDLIEANRNGDVDELAFVLCGHDGEYEAGLIGGSNPPYLIRSIDAVADAIEASRLDLISFGRLPEPPPASVISAEQLTDYHSRINATLQDLVATNERGRIAGTAAIVFGQQGTFYRLVGTIQPDFLARTLRQLRDRVALGQPGRRRNVAN